MDDGLRRMVEAMKAAPPRPLPADFAERVIGQTLARRSDRMGLGERVRRFFDFLFAPRRIALRPVWQVAWMLAACALGVWGGSALQTPEGSRKEVWVRFAVQAPRARQVSVAGDFNNWAPGQILLEDAEGDGVWHGLVRLAPGVYQYMFVLDGETWIADPLAGEKVDDGFGRENSLVRVFAPRERGDDSRI